ncbi:homeobox and leucine zipper encoding a [Chanos chanos]|uniref:Homeobox and leucine zipper encoding a n=1 Tax=Chanos chanos TaxID=29144 RepID=A0A6J2VIT0_CHACN|nr:homeobox and leucine zipper protein Homez [Chanos chanos]
MATHCDSTRGVGIDDDIKEPSSKGAESNKEREEKHASPNPKKAVHHSNINGKSHPSPPDHRATDRNGTEKEHVSFSTNHNSVVCLPLVSEGLKLVWTQSDQTRELDTIPELVQAFNVFPYPTSREVSALARLCALPLDKVKVWFMVQRIKYGISWASEEIEETRRKLAGPERVSVNKVEDSKIRKRKNGSEEFVEDDDDKEDSLLLSPRFPSKRPKNESPEPAKLPPAVPHFRSSLPPPQDSYYYRHPVDTPAATPVAASLSSLESPLASQQQRQGRYKKSKAQLAALRSSFLRENWPDEAELRRLQEETGLSRNEIRKWFSDSRYQQRNGRAGSGLTSPSTTHGVNSEPQSHPLSLAPQLQPLSLVSHGPRNQQQNGVTGKVHGEGKGIRGKGMRSGGSSHSHFFQLFLSNTLEAFGESATGTDEGETSAEEVSEEKPKDESEILREEEDNENEELSKDCVVPVTEPEPEPEPQAPASPSPSSPSPSDSAASPKKRTSTKSSSAQKPARSAKANNSVTSSPLSSPSSTSRALTPAGRPRKTKEQLDVLKQHFLRCQWPKSEDYTQLVELTGLPRADVIQWFGDTRYAVKNGQLRWVRGVRDQILAEIALQQNGGGGAGAKDSNKTPKNGSSRKRKSHVNGGSSTPTSAKDSPDVTPLELYRTQIGALQEKDLDTLCRKSKMSYQQVRDWFASQDSELLMTNSELNVTD